MIFSDQKRASFVFEIIEDFTIYKKMTELGACFAIFDRKTFKLSFGLIDSGREKDSASSEVTPTPSKLYFHRGLGKKLLFQADIK
jgi:hypothetical protein